MRPPYTFDVSAAAYARAMRQMPVPVPVTCAECGVKCLDAAGKVRTTRDRLKREDHCDDCKRTLRAQAQQQE